MTRILADFFRLLRAELSKIYRKSNINYHFCFVINLRS